MSSEAVKAGLDRQRYGFGPFTLDAGSRTLHRGSALVALSPKEFHTLLLLVQAEGNVVERDAMISAIWPDVVVGDTSLGRNVSVLRRHLGTEAIKSVPKYGYRFAIPVQVLSEAEAETVTAEPVVQETFRPVIASAGRTWSQTWWAVAAMVLLIAGLLGATLLRRPNHSARPLVGAARWEQVGLFALREGTYFKASKAFREAVRLEPDAVMPHAHLAAALLELDLPGPANQEILLATNHLRSQSVPELDQSYLNAIRATAVRDFPAAVREYRAILDLLPEEERADGYEDLGRAQQRAGDLAGAVSSYQKAADLQATNAGVQLRLGVLMGLRHDQAAANVHLDRAAELYAVDSNMEGSAEVSYQRGNMAYVRADYAEAERRYKSSLEDALRLNDAQLQARGWGALSTIHRWDGKMAESESAARHEIEISQAAGWEFGYADGVMHLANVAIARKDLKQARGLLGQALGLAKTVQHARLTANAEYSMADLAGDEGDYAEELTQARHAEADYQSYGSVDGVEDAKLLIVCAEYGAGKLGQALDDAEELLQMAKRTHSDVFVEDTEEELGDIYIAMDDLPQALTHYQAALAMAKKTGSQPELKAMGLAACLARMGRVGEAAALIAALPLAATVDPDYQHRYAEARVSLAMETGKYVDALRLAHEAAARATPAAAACFLEMAAEAEIKLRRDKEASRDADQLVQVARKTHNEFRLQRAHLLVEQLHR